MFGFQPIRGEDQYDKLPDSLQAAVRGAILHCLAQDKPDEVRGILGWVLPILALGSVEPSGKPGEFRVVPHTYSVVLFDGPETANCTCGSNSRPCCHISAAWIFQSAYGAVADATQEQPN